jgi:hypothetical protein
MGQTVKEKPSLQEINAFLNAQKTSAPTPELRQCFVKFEDLYDRKYVALVCKRLTRVLQIVASIDHGAGKVCQFTFFGSVVGACLRKVCRGLCPTLESTQLGAVPRSRQQRVSRYDKTPYSDCL